MKFAKRMERMQSSEIRELLKLTAQPDIISFAGGLPAPELFPVKEIAKVSQDRKSTRLNSSHDRQSRMPSSA